MDEAKINTAIAKFQMDAMLFPKRFHFKRDGMILRGTHLNESTGVGWMIGIFGIGAVLVFAGTVVPLLGWIGVFLIGISLLMIGIYFGKNLFSIEVIKKDVFVFNLATGEWKSNNDEYFKEVRAWLDTNYSDFSKLEKRE